VPADVDEARLPVPVPPPSVTSGPASARNSDRISDRDRDLTVARLRSASGQGVLDLDEFSDRVELVYAARTRDDLERLAADLPELPAPPPAETFRPVEWTVAVLSSHRQAGPWRPARPTRAVAVLGSCRLDLCEAQLDDETEIEATTVFGGVDIVVPDGARVELTGFVFAGSRQYRIKGSFADDAPVLHVRARGAFGGVTVRTRPRPAP